MTTEINAIAPAPQAVRKGRFVPIETLQHILHVLGGIPSGQQIGQRKIADLFLEMESIVVQPMGSVEPPLPRVEP